MRTLALALLLASASSASAQPAPPPRQARSAPLSPAQLPALLRAVNDAGIAAAQLAQGRAQSALVKAFAARALADHQQSNAELAALAPKLGAAPQQSGASSLLSQNGSQRLAALRTVSGAPFDRAYVDGEADAQREALGALEQAIPAAAGSPPLAALLSKARSAAASRLSEAEKLSASLH